MSEFQEYPKMLYRPAKDEGEMVWGERVDTLVVHSYRKEFYAIKEGWLIDPVKACAISARMKKRLLFYAWLLSYWPVWLGSAIGIAAIIAQILTAK
jgi:hypothetical protein